MNQVATIALAALLALAVGLAVRRWVVFLATVESVSMLPALMPGQKLLARRLATSRPLRRGDIVVVDSDELSQVIVKRVAGLPDEHSSFDGVSFSVPPGRLLLLGDNRVRSSDSRNWRHPYVPVDRVLGRMIGLRKTPAAATLRDRGSRSPGLRRHG